MYFCLLQGGPISPIPHENEEKQFNASLKSFNLSDNSILEETDNEVLIYL